MCLLGICLLRDLGRQWQQCRKGALNMVSHCVNALSCGSAAVFDSILVQRTGERKYDHVPLSHALRRSIPATGYILDTHGYNRPLNDGRERS